MGGQRRGRKENVYHKKGLQEQIEDPNENGVRVSALLPIAPLSLEGPSWCDKEAFECTQRLECDVWVWVAVQTHPRAEKKRRRGDEEPEDEVSRCDFHPTASCHL